MKQLKLVGSTRHSDPRSLNLSNSEEDSWTLKKPLSQMLLSGKT